MLRGSTPESRRPGRSGSTDDITWVSSMSGERTRRSSTMFRSRSTTKPANSSANWPVSIGAWIVIGVNANSRSATPSTSAFVRKTNHSSGA
jgi:hypothetical protein